MKENLKEIKENIAEIDRMTKEIENTDILDLSNEGVHIEKKSVSDTINAIKKSFFGGRFGA
jgi:hypothetical protein